MRGARPRAQGTRRLVCADASLAAQARVVPAVDRRGRQRRSGGAGGCGRAHRFWLPHHVAPGAAAAAAAALPPLLAPQRHPQRHTTAAPPPPHRHAAAMPPPGLGQRSHVRPLRRTRRVGCRPSRVANGPRCRHWVPNGLSSTWARSRRWLLTCPRHCALVPPPTAFLPFAHTPALPPLPPIPPRLPLHPLLSRISTHLNRISTASQLHLNQRLGHAWQVASGGYLLATPHRVLSTAVTRLSVPFFYNPSLETVVEPLALPSSLAWERDAAYDSQTRRRS